MKNSGRLTVVFVCLVCAAMALPAQTVKKPKPHLIQSRSFQAKPEHNKQFMNKLENVVKMIVQDESYSRRAKNEFIKALNPHVTQFPHRNVMEALFKLFKDAINEQNKDKAYWLRKLADANNLADALGEYLNELNDMAIDIGGGEGSGDSDDDGWGDDDDHNPQPKVPVPVKDYSLTVNSALKMTLNDPKTKTSPRNKINMKFTRKLIRNKREAIAFKLNFKRQIAQVNRLKEKLKKAYRAQSFKLKHLQSRLPSIKAQMSADAAKILRK